MVRATLVRFAVFAAILAIADALIASADFPDAPIGLGLLVFLLLSITAAVLAAVDGVRMQRRGQRLTSWLAVWLVVSAATGVALAARSGVVAAVTGDGFSPEVLVDDLLSLFPVGVGLVGVPATLSLVVAAATEGWRGRAPQPPRGQRS